MRIILTALAVIASLLIAPQAAADWVRSPKAFSCAASGQLGRPNIYNAGPRQNTVKGVNGKKYYINARTTLKNVCPSKVYVHASYDIGIRCSNKTNPGVLTRYGWNKFPTWCSGGGGSHTITLNEYKQ